MDSPGPGDAGPPLSRLRSTTSLLGGLVALTGAVFVVWALVDEWDTAVAAFLEADPYWIGAAFVLGMVGMGSIALLWWKALELVGAPVRMREALVWYFIGELGKYVPGGIWAVVGRAEVTVRGGVVRSRAYGAVLLSLGLTYLGAGLLALLLLPHGIDGGGEKRWVLWLILPLVLGAVVVHPAILGRGLRVLRRALGRPVKLEMPPWPSSLKLVLANVPGWMSNGLATWCVMRALGGQAPMGEIIFAAVLSWTVGFLVVPVPSGIGVREGVFVLAAGSLSGGVAATVAVTARILFVVVDAAGAAIGATLGRNALRGPRDGGEDTGPHRD